MWFGLAAEETGYGDVTRSRVVAGDWAQVTAADVRQTIAGMSLCREQRDEGIAVVRHAT